MVTKKPAVNAPAVMTKGLSLEQIDLVKRTVARGATDDELALFLYTAAKTGLDPLTKQVHFIKRRVWSKNLNGGRGGYDEVGTTQTGIDGYRVIASRNGLAGIDDAIFDDEEGTNPKKASVTVYKMMEGQRVPFTATARWSEYAVVDKEMNPVAMWKKMPFLMLAKVAEALALRKAFPNDLSGLYTNEEMAQADDKVVVYPAEYDSSKIPATAKAISTGDDLGGEDRRVVPPGEEEQMTIETGVEASIKEESGELVCSDTGKPITAAEYDYSMKFYGKPLSRESQKNHTRIK